MTASYQESIHWHKGRGAIHNYSFHMARLQKTLRNSSIPAVPSSTDVGESYTAFIHAVAGSNPLPPLPQPHQTLLYHSDDALPPLQPCTPQLRESYTASIHSVAGAKPTPSASPSHFTPSTKCHKKAHENPHSSRRCGDPPTLSLLKVGEGCTASISPWQGRDPPPPLPPATLPTAPSTHKLPVYCLPASAAS